MSEQDDQDWFNLVAGRQVPEASALARQEAALIRHALDIARTQDSVQRVAIPEQDPIRERALIDQAHTVIKDAAKNQTPTRFRRVTSVFGQWLHGWRPGFAVATVVAIVALTYVWMPIQPRDNQPDVVRGGGPTVYARQVAEPERVSKELADTLVNAGIKVVPRHEGNTWFVEFEMPDAPAPSIVHTMEQLDVRDLRAGPTMVALEKNR